MAATLKQERDLLIEYLYQERPEDSDYANRSDFFLYSLLLKSQELGETYRSNLNSAVLPHLEDRLKRDQENGLMLCLFLNSLTPEEKKSFEGILSDILPKSKQGGEEYLKNISQSSLANPQIYEGWGFGFKMNEGEPIKTIDGTKYIEVEVTEVFEGSKLTEQGVKVGDKIRVQITEEQLKSIDPIDIGKVAGLIRGAEKISVVRQGEETETEINQDQKGIFALGEKNKHTSFENLSEARVKTCFTQDKQKVDKLSPGTRPSSPVIVQQFKEPKEEEGVFSI